MIPRYKVWLFYGLTVTAGVVSTASMYMRKLLEDRIFDQDICRLCIDILQQHEKSVDTLGLPLTFKRPSMANTFNNITHTDASIAIRVNGIKTAGNLLINAKKKETDTQWTLKSLVLEVPKQKIVIKN